MLLKAIKRRLHRPREREIPLERLARLWIEDDPEAMPNQRSNQKLTRTWTNKDINSFYSQYVEPVLPPSDPARPAVQRLLTILDEHGDCPSAIPASESLARVMHEGPKEEHIFAEISLREYALEVARIALDMIRKGHSDYEMIAGKILIIALGHQIGMISDADIFGGVSSKSVLVLDPVIQDLSYRESIVNAIRTYTANHLKTAEARILRAASSAARKNEYERAKVFSKVWRQSPVDIGKIKAAIEPEANREEA